MSDFEQWFRSLNANGKTVYFLGNEHKVSEMAWNHQQAKINELQRRVDNALQMLSDWDDQTYRDDAEQLIGELGDVLRGEHETD